MGNAKVFGYARVSSRDQNLGRQLDALKAAGVEERDIFTDKASGASFDRAGYQALLQVLRPGDCVVILSLDRLGRNYTEIRNQWQHITRELGADIFVIDSPMLDTRKHGDLDQRFIADLVLEILAYVAERERQSIRERQRQGIELAKKGGKHMGRPSATKPENWDTVISEWQAGNITATEAMKQLNMKRTTFYKLVKAEKNA